jgi:hypothetical protein
MEGKWNVWEQWYLTTLDKQGKVECKFCNNVISYCKNKIIFHLGYQHNGSGKVGLVMCLKAWAQFKPLFATCGRIVLWLIDDMVVLTLDGRIDNVPIKAPNPLVKGEFPLTFQVEGAWICTPHLRTSYKILIDSQITTFEPFNKVHYKTNGT